MRTASPIKAIRPDITARPDSLELQLSEQQITSLVFVCTSR